MASKISGCAFPEWEISPSTDGNLNVKASITGERHAIEGNRVGPLFYKYDEDNTFIERTREETHHPSHDFK